MVAARRERSRPIVCATTARGRGARAAADRRAQAALQPPLPLPRAGPVGQAHRRGRSRGCRIVREVARRRRPLPRPVRARGRRPRRAIAALHEAFPLRQCTRAALPRRAASAPARWPRWAAAARLHRRAVASTTTPRWSPRRVDAARRRRPRRGRRPCARGWPTLAAQERFEEAGAVRDRLLAPGRAARRAPSGSRRWPRSAELVAARPRRRTAAGRSSCVRHGRLAGSRRHPARAPTRCRTSHALRASAEAVAAAPAPCPAATRRGDREDPALARVPRRAAGRRRRRSGPARSAVPRGCRAELDAADASRPSRSPVRRPAADRRRRPARAGPARVTP